MKFSLKPESAIDITLEGSVGFFSIGDVNSLQNKSIDVTYLETHVGFDPSIETNYKLLKHLAPVREIFPSKELNFDEIMQRDIDDARVSTELIPYLLDSKSRGSVKFFPPLVVVVLPVKQNNTQPDRFYPKVEAGPKTKPGDDNQFFSIRSGAVGSEAFEFEYPTLGGQPRLHDLARLKLNTNRVKLVIIDGQHRAMALLALYRNLTNDWNDERRISFKEYYAEWTKSRIEKFELKRLHLPIVICTFPEIDVDYKGELDIIEASRRMFLTLNESARKVSRSRNLLLNDQDLISHFMREVLRGIKARDLFQNSSLRIWNVELDQSGDRQSIESTIACTGVSHFYYMIEHMLLDDESVNGISARLGRFSSRRSTRTTECLIFRLNGANILGSSVAGSIKRDDYTRSAADTLAISFMNTYGNFLVKTFDNFEPFEIHCKAALDIEASLKGHKNPQIKNILFDGQNIGKTFKSYREHLMEIAKSKDTLLPSEIKSIIDHLNGTHRAVEETKNDFKERRLNLYFDKFHEKSKLKDSTEKYSPIVGRVIQKLYDDVYSTVAFQSALVCGFFHLIEIFERNQPTSDPSLAMREEAFSDYIKNLNLFFVPQTIAKLKNLIRVFFYDVAGEKASDWKQIATGESFHDIVYRGEMKPDEWPKYRLVLLEIWSPENIYLKEIRDNELLSCRLQSFKSFYKSKVSEHSLNQRLSEQDFKPSDWEFVFSKSFSAFENFCSNFPNLAINRLSKAKARESISKVEGSKTSEDAITETFSKDEEGGKIHMDIAQEKEGD
jgi:hypothetical protein